MNTNLIALLLYILIVLLGFMSVTTAKAAPKIMKVAVLDTGFGFDAELNKKAFKICDTGSYDFTTNLPIVGDDNIGHGTTVTSLINEHADTKNMCFIIYKVLGSGRKDVNNIDKALVAAYRERVDVINISIEIYMHSDRTNRILKNLTNRGTKVFAASGNSGKDLGSKCNIYPACYRNLNQNFVPVGALDEDFDVAKYSNYGAFITVYKYGRTVQGARGTSFASPRAAGDYIKSLNMDGK